MSLQSCIIVRIKPIREQDLLHSFIPYALSLVSQARTQLMHAKRSSAVLILLHNFTARTQSILNFEIWLLGLFPSKTASILGSEMQFNNFELGWLCKRTC